MTSRRQVLLGALGLALTACSTETVADVPGRHVALRRPKPAGQIALLNDVSPEAVRKMHQSGDDVAIGLGVGFFDAVAQPRPAGLVEMPPFPGEVLRPERSNAHVVVQIEGDTPEAVAARADAVLGGARIGWRAAVRREIVADQAGKSLQRNSFGFVEGQGNPVHEQLAGAVLRADGSSLLALRVIQLAQDAWNADDPVKQQRIIGRKPDGSWLDGSPSAGEPSFAGDPDGAVTPLDSHVRKANPRTPGVPSPRMLRRSWIYQGGPADDGVVFMAFQSDFEAGFALAQNRLRGEALAPYLLTVGGGYFVVPARDNLGAYLPS
ncbi:deferrochelatase/peroxidase EfeB [Amycolatopsis xylanica]|uniref:Deferrochelatase/peroxidase EfeB n=1 Tax=Amycolatopsis xylanica TaxID=589385 RepID=A0A1H3SXV9_9PSEU|nr:Dyp-type peroxidase [Amycolatopsis xylanica]SDZ42335.1 deferrochelatase/peroxidase EfeB [Amycolatopsis xylanica]